MQEALPREQGMADLSVVLVIDDDPVIRMFVCEILNERGFEVLAASSADEGLGILQNRPDVRAVLTDIVMPGTLDGLGLVSEIRRRWPRLGVIIASGRMPAIAAANATETVFLEKPFDEAGLAAALSQALPG
jgi:DNA-binding NtrC family response regulator